MGGGREGKGEGRGNRAGLHLMVVSLPPPFFPPFQPQRQQVFFYFFRKEEFFLWLIWEIECLKGKARPGNKSTFFGGGEGELYGTYHVVPLDVGYQIFQ